MAIDIIVTPNPGTVDIVEVTTGLKGDRGLRGLGIKDAVLQKDGHFVVTYEDGTTKDTGLTAFVETSQYAVAAKTFADASQKSAEASASSAQESSTSATASAKSAEEAKSSSDKASVSANESADSATDASKSAESASTSETNAFASATNAKKSEDASKLSETNAKASETASAKSAESASASATKAKTSETNAGNSATQASESAAKAATSEANAKTSETNADTSATKAKISEDNAKKSETTVINKVNEVTANSTLSKVWAVSEESPDGEEDVKSETGKTQSSRTWALLAKTKAGEASSSAANANNSVTEATNQAKIASTKATESNDSAVASAESAAAAKASETNAKAYETESSKNASSASTSAGKAKTSETNAANSESNALQYKTNAEESKTAAAASASNASKSEVNAKASMNSAATSATSASTSATKAATSESHAATSETNAKQALAESQKIQKEVEAALTKVTGFAKYAGSVDNYSDLPVSGNNVGDVWNIVNADAAHQIKAGDNVIWNGKTWDNLSGFVDLSNYPTNADVAKAVVDTTYSGGTITFIHKDGTKSTATIGDTSHATQADQDGEGNNIVETYYKKADASTIHQSFQNQINTKQNKLTFDSSPTDSSSNPVTSGGIKTALDAKLDKTGGTVTGSITATSFIGNLTGNADTATKATKDGNGNVIATTYYKANNANIMHKNLQNQINDKQDKLTFDTTPTADSTNPVTSGGIKTALDNRLVKSDYASTAAWSDGGLAVFSKSATNNKTEINPNFITIDDGTHIMSMGLEGGVGEIAFVGLSDGIQHEIKFSEKIQYSPSSGTVYNIATESYVDTAISKALASIADGDSKSY